MSLEREQFVEIFLHRPAHEVTVFPSPEIAVQCVQHFPGISVHPHLGQTVRFRDAVTVNFHFGALPLLLLGLLCGNCDQPLLFGAGSLLAGKITLLRRVLFCCQSTITLPGHADIGKHGYAEQNGQYGCSNSDLHAILMQAFAKEVRCGRRFSS